MIMNQTFEEFEASWRELENRPENKVAEGKIICACGNPVKHKPLTESQLQEMYTILNNDVRRI